MPGTTPTSPVPLAEWAKRIQSPSAMKFVEAIYAGESPLKYLNLATDPALFKAVQQVNNAGLPQPTWRNVNQQVGQALGGTNLVAAPMMLFGDTMSVDVATYDAWEAAPGSMPDPLEQQYQMYGQAWRLDFTGKFFLNDGSSTNAGTNQYNSPKAPVGLWYRFKNSTLMARYKHNSALRVDASGIDITLATGTAANALRFLNYLTKTARLMGSLNSKYLCLYANAQVWENLETLLASGTYFAQTKDQFGNPITEYKGWKCVPILTGLDGTTDIIPLVETSAGTALSGGDRTSVYLVDHDPLRTYAWQRKVLKPEKLAKNGAFMESLVESGIGWLNAHDRQSARIFNVKA